MSSTARVYGLQVHANQRHSPHGVRHRFYACSPVPLSYQRDLAAGRGLQSKIDMNPVSSTVPATRPRVLMSTGSHSPSCWTGDSGQVTDHVPGLPFILKSRPLF